jgi:hypothetical protein
MVLLNIGETQMEMGFLTFRNSDFHPMLPVTRWPYSLEGRFWGWS